MQLLMIIAMVAYLMPFLRSPCDQLRPTFHVATQEEKCRVHVMLSERIENGSRRAWIGAIIEGERNGVPVVRQPAKCVSKNTTVVIERAVRGDARRKHGWCRPPEESSPG